MFCKVNGSLPTPKSLKFHDYCVSLICSSFLASYRKGQMHYVQPLDPRHGTLISITCHVCHTYCIFHHWTCKCVMYSPMYYSLYVVTIECPGRREVQRLLSLFWSAALASLIHRNPLREYCSPVDWRILEENAPLASEWSTTLGVESWAQHPPHTQIWARVQPVRESIRGLYGAENFSIHNKIFVWWTNVI